MTNMQHFAASIQQPKRISWLKWLRRFHAWVGLWGAALGLLFGVSGVLLNHRMVMKIPAVQMEQSQVELILPTPPPANAEELAKWLQGYAAIDRKPSRISVEPAKTVRWAGQNLQQPSQWRVDFHNPQHSLTAEYWVGNSYVSVKHQDANVFAFITRLHKGVGMGTAWVLLADSLAGGLVFLSLTGILLWTKLHGSRLAMAGLGMTSLGLGIFIVLSSL